MPLDALPHRPPALLLERVLARDTTELTVRPGPWLRDGALAPEALVEALAQTCAVFSGGARGVLASVARFSFPSRAEPGDTVRLHVTLDAHVGPLAAFTGVARVGDREVARGELRVAHVS